MSSNDLNNENNESKKWKRNISKVKINLIIENGFLYIYTLLHHTLLKYI